MAENNNSIGLNELVDYQKKTYSPTMDRIMKFLWKCAGADPQILQFAPYSDHIKNAGIGAIVPEKIWQVRKNYLLVGCVPLQVETPGIRLVGIDLGAVIRSMQ
jgi:hypothetical protein